MSEKQGKIAYLGHTASVTLTALLYPSRCIGCGKLLLPEQNWCAECWASLAIALGRKYCPTCASFLGPHQMISSRGRCFNCKKLTLPINGICRLGSYEGTLMDVIKCFKYNSDIYSGKILAGMLAQSLLDQDWLEEVDAFCPIPIHWTRRLARGFNQARIIADGLSEETSIPRMALLRRVRPTPQQVGLNAAERARNIKDAFLPKRRWPLEGATVCLVDDVMTTGSTLHEAARTLKRAGVKTVYAAVLAKAEHTSI